MAMQKSYTEVKEWRMYQDGMCNSSYGFYTSTETLLASLERYNVPYKEVIAISDDEIHVVTNRFGIHRWKREVTLYVDLAYTLTHIDLQFVLA